MPAAQRAKRAMSTPKGVFRKAKKLRLWAVLTLLSQTTKFMSKRPKYAGIYKIIIRAEGAVYLYVGKSTNLLQRYHQHQCALRAGTHVNSKLQELYDKYGASSMEFEIIEVCEDTSSLERREIYWTKALGADVNIMNTRLSPSDVQAIKLSLSRGTSVDEVARSFGISSKYLREILRGKRWVD